MKLPDRPLSPLDLFDLQEEPAAELTPVLERALEQGDSELRAALTSLLLDRSLRVLRQGSRIELLEEALLVSQAVSDSLGDRLREQDPAAFGAFDFLQEQLGEAGQRVDRAAVPSLLRGTRGKEIVELLASEGKPLQRSELRRRLELGEAQLSHLLSDLEEADLLRRYRPDKGREVLVELGTAGKELAATEILPAWTQRLLTEIDSVRRGRPTPPEAFANELEAAGAPSRTVASRLAEKLATLRFPDLRLAGEVRDSGEEKVGEDPGAALPEGREARVRAALAVLGTIGEEAAETMSQSVRQLRSLPC